MKKELIKVIILLVILGAGILAYIQLRRIQVDAESLISDRLKQLLGKEAGIGRISVSLLGYIDLRDITVLNYENIRSMNCKRVLVKFSLIRSLLKKQPIENIISHMVFYSPSISIYPVSEKYGTSLDIPLACDIIVKDGRLNMEAAEEASFNSVYGSCRLSKIKKELKFMLRAKMDSGPANSIKCNGEWSAERIFVKVDAANTDIGNLYRVIFNENRFTINGGTGDVALILSREKKQEDFYYSGSLTLRNGILNLKDRIFSAVIEKGKIVFDRKRITCDTLVLKQKNSKIMITGNIDDFLSTSPKLNFRAEASFELADLPDFVNESWVTRLMPLRGRGIIESRVTGAPDNPSCFGSLVMTECSAAGVYVKNFEGKFNYENHVFNVQEFRVGAYEGALNGSGTIDFSNIKKPIADLSFSAGGINIASMGFIREPHKGYMDLKARFSGEMGNLQCSGDMNIRKMEVSGYTAGSFNGPFYYKDGRLQFNMKEADNFKQLEMDCRWNRQEKKLTLNKFQAVLNDGSMLQLNGVFYPGEKDNVEVEVTAQNFVATHIPFIRNSYPAVNGFLNFNGQVKGPLKSILVSGSFKTDKLAINGVNIDAEAVFNYFNKVLVLKTFNINNSCYGNISVDLSDKKPRLMGGVKCVDSDLRVILNIIPFPVYKDMAGIVNGNMDFYSSAAKKQMEVKGKFNLRDVALGMALVIKSVELDFNIADDKFVVKQFSCTSGQGWITGDAFVGLGADKGNPIKVNMKVDNYLVKISSQLAYNALLDGDCSYSGSLSVDSEWKVEMKGSLFSKTMFFNGKPAEEVSARVDSKKGMLNIQGIRIGKNIKGRVSVNLKAPLTINGSISAVSDDITGLVNRFSDKDILYKDRIIGRLSGEVSFYGPVSAPEFEGIFEINNGRFRTKNMDFTLKSRISYKDMVLTIESSKLKFGYPYGDINTYGRIKYGAENSLEIDNELKNVPIELIDDLLADNTKIEGIVDGNIYIRGKLKDPLVRADLISGKCRISGQQFNNVKTKFQVKDASVGIDSLSAEYGQSIIRLGKGSVLTRKSKRVYDYFLSVHLRNAGLKNLSLFGELELEGDVDLSNKNPVINSEITIKNLWINQWNIANIKTRLDYRDYVLKYIYAGKHASLGLKIYLGEPGVIKVENIEFYEMDKKVLKLAGQINLKDGFVKGNLSTLNNGMNARVFSELLNSKEEQKGRVTFNIDAEGHWLDLLSGAREYLEEKPVISGTFEMIEGNIKFLNFDRLRASFRSDKNEIDLKYFQLLKNGKFSLDAAGKLPYEVKSGTPSGNNGIKARISGENSLELITYVSQTIEGCTGVMDGGFTITGQVNNPVVNGYLKGKNGSVTKKIEKPFFGNKLTDIAVDIIIENNNLLIRKLHGNMKDSWLDITGNILLKKGAMDTFNLDINADGGNGILIEVPYLAIPTGLLSSRWSEVPSSGRIKGNMKAYGSVDAYRIDGELEINDAHFSYPMLPKDVGKDALEFLDPADWNLELKSGRNVRYTRQYVSARINGGLTITGNTRELMANGRIKAIDGDVYYLRSNYKLKEANLEVIDNNVYIDAIAETEISGDTIKMIVERSKFPDLKIKFASLTDKEMSSEDASLRVAGMYNKDLSESERVDMYRQEILKSLDMTFTAPFLEDAIWFMRIPIDKVKIEFPMFESLYRGIPITSLPIRLILEKNIDNEGLLVTYVTTSEISDIEGRYFELSKNANFLSRLFKLPEGGEFIKVRQILGTGERIFMLEKQVRFR